MCSNCEDHQCGEDSELVGVTGAGVVKLGSWKWLAVAYFTDISDKGMRVEKCLTHRGARRRSRKMAEDLADIRVAVMQAEDDGR